MTDVTLRIRGDASGVIRASSDASRAVAGIEDAAQQAGTAGRRAGQQIAEDTKQGAVEVNEAAEATDDVGQAAAEGEQTQPDDQPTDQNPPDAGETVPALVLHDSVYGKCGEVKQFPADAVEGIAAAGYIDPHPNAVKSAKG